MLFPELTSPISHLQLPSLSAPVAGCDTTVVIPVRNEAASLDRTLQALAGQWDHDRRPLSDFEILLLANNCRDDSARVIRRFGERHPELTVHLLEVELPTGQAHVGRARKLLMDLACARLLAVGRPAGIIASTDADSRVAPDWLARIRAAMACGADAVAGWVDTSGVERQALDEPLSRHLREDHAHHWLASAAASRLDPAPHDPWPRHRNRSGASLAVSAAAYRACGGLPALPTGEDRGLYRALLRSGARVRHCPRVRVSTSLRWRGRARGGMADWLARHRLNSRPRRVVAVAPWLRHWRLRGRLRACWSARGSVAKADLGHLAQGLGLAPDWLLHRWRERQPFGVIEDRLEALLETLPLDTEIGHAIGQLQDWHRGWRSGG